MEHERNRPHLRLESYDYTSAGAYFITLTTAGGACIFGEIAEGRVILSPFGRIAEEEWRRSCELRAEIALDAFVVMPNHLHGIVWIREREEFKGAGIGEETGANCRLHVQGIGEYRSPRPRRGLASFIAGFKSYSTKRINDCRETPGAKIWHANYFEHVIRSEQSLNRIRQYVLDNPAQWALDSENPLRKK